MTTLNITLPDSIREFAEQQAAEQGLATVDDSITGLVRDQQRRKAKAKLEALLLERLDSGSSIEVTDQYWDDKIRKLEVAHPEEVGP